MLVAYLHHRPNVAATCGHDILNLMATLQAAFSQLNGDIYVIDLTTICCLIPSSSVTQVLLHRRLGHRMPEALYIGRHMQRLDIGDAADAMPVAPAE